MSDFHERLARLADTLHALPDGEEAARALLRLAADLDTYLQQERGARYDQGMDLFQKWNEFLIATVEDNRRYYEGRLSLERRKLARAIAADPRWQGGYAGALALLEEGKERGQ